MNNTEGWAPAAVLTSRRGLGRNSVRFRGPSWSASSPDRPTEDVHTIVPADTEEQLLIMTETIPTRPFDEMGFGLAAFPTGGSRDCQCGGARAPMGLEQDADRTPVESVGEGWFDSS